MSKIEYYGIFNDSFPPIMDGVTLTVQNYTYWLKQKGHEPCVVTPWNPQNLTQDFKVMKFFSVPIRGRAPYRYGYPKLDPFIWHRLKRTPFRILHSHCPFSSGRLAVYTKKHQDIPLIGTFHSKYREDLEHWFAHSPWMVRIIMGRILNFFNACDHVWIPQAFVEPTIREYGYKGPVEVMENGNDFTDIPLAGLPAFRQQAKKELGIQDSQLSLLFVGQHIWEKGVGIILDALSLLKDEIPFTMTFVGDGYAKKEMQEKIKKSGLSDRVTMKGVVTERDRLKEIYAAADLFLFPSFYDNAPLVMREAAAVGTPTLLLRNSTAAEVINDGKNGFLTDRTADNYAEAIRHFADHKEELRKAGEGARTTLVRSWENVVDEVALRYSDILRRYNSRTI